VSFPGAQDSRESKLLFPNSRELKNIYGNDNSTYNVFDGMLNLALSIYLGVKALFRDVSLSVTV